MPKWVSPRNRCHGTNTDRPRWLGVERVGALSQQRRRRRRRTRTATTMQRSSLSVALACIALCCCNTRAEYCPSANDLTVAYTVPTAVHQLRDGGWQSKGGPSPSPGCSCPVVISCVISISCLSIRLTLSLCLSFTGVCRCLRRRSPYFSLPRSPARSLPRALPLYLTVSLFSILVVSSLPCLSIHLTLSVCPCLRRRDRGHVLLQPNWWIGGCLSPYVKYGAPGARGCIPVPWWMHTPCSVW
jgi:hypothetical protein